MDAVFKALADPSRRRLLDQLNQRNGQNLRELCAGLDMARQSVTKHLAVLEAAGLVTSWRQGREKLHYLNAAPINEIADRWIGRYNRERVRALADLKHALEDDTMASTDFVYVTYIRSTPEKLWQALTEDAFIERYYGGYGSSSDWKLGSPVLTRVKPGGEYRDLGQVVLESEPCRRLAFTWHNYKPEHAEIFGWTPEHFAELVKEPISKVGFDIEPVGAGVKLTVVHDGFVPDSEMLKSVSQGWPAVLSSLKTLLETGESLPAA
jgi:DNA-binding transcriptional ArsR family regulator